MTKDICLFDGFAWDKTYELIYPAKDPWVMGLGYGVTRDLAFPSSDTIRPMTPAQNPLAVDGDLDIRRA